MSEEVSNQASSVCVASAKEVWLLSMPQLKERGWTPALVKRFLDPPDTIKPNPYYRSAAPMKLYAIPRVEEVEQLSTFIEAQEKSFARSQVGKEVSARKATELIAQSETFPIVVQRLSLETVRRRAIASYNAFHAEMSWKRGYDHETANEQSDTVFLERITVNYIRHEITAYDKHLEDVAGKIGVSEAVSVIRRRVYAEIAHVYPEYADECVRQEVYRSTPDTM